METIDYATNNGTICRFLQSWCDWFRNQQRYHLWYFWKEQFGSAYCVYAHGVLASYFLIRVETIVWLLKIILLPSFCWCTSLRAGFQVYLSQRWVLICHQGSTIRFVVVLSWIHHTLYLWFVGRMAVQNVAGVLQEAGDAYSRARTWSQV